MNNIWTVLLNVAWIVLGFVAIYFKTRTNIVEIAAEKIAEAEEKYKDIMKAGSLKQEFVVDFIYNTIPAPMKLFFNKDIIRSLVQSVFDQVSRYAITQLDKIFNKDKKEEAIPEK